jgi:hypothetical protein
LQVVSEPFVILRVDPVEDSRLTMLAKCEIKSCRSVFPQGSAVSCLCPAKGPCINWEVHQMKQVTLNILYEKIIELQRDVAQIKKTLIEEPDLCDDFILRMQKIDLESSIPVEDFGKRYGLR